MRFPVFSSDHFTLHPQFYSCGPSTGRRGRCCSIPRMNPSYPFSSPGGAWPSSAAATFIPVMVGRRHSSGPRQNHSDEPSSRQTPPPFCTRERVGQPFIDDAITIAQGLLGEMFGQPSSRSSGTGQGGQATGCDRSRSKQGAQTTASDLSSSRCSSRGNCDKESSASSRRPLQRSREPSPQEETESSAKEVQKTEDPSAEEKPMNSRDAMTGDPQWSYSLSLAGFDPQKVSVKVKNGRVHVHAVHKKTVKSGPGACLSKLVITQAVTLPDTVDQQTVTCCMKPDGTLWLRAHFKTNLAVKKSEEMGESENRADKMVALENKADRMNALENRSGKLQALENKAQSLGALENKGERMDALEDKSEKIQALENKPENLQGLEEASGVEAQQKTSEETVAEPDASDSDSPAEAEVVEPQLSDAACSSRTVEEGLAEDKLSELSQQSKDEPQKNDAGDGEPEQDMAQAEKEDDADDQNTTAEKNYHVSFLIIQEPDDDAPSSDEEGVMKTHSLSHQSSTEDFVVIGEDFSNAETMNCVDEDEDGGDNENIPAGVELVSNSQKQEEAGEESNTSDETDPTRPTKRTDNPEPTNGVKEDISTPCEQPSPFNKIDDPQPTLTDHGAFNASLPLAGFKPEDVHINLQGHTLSIMAKRQAWLEDASYTESVERQLELPEHLDALTLRCVCQQDKGCLVITADPKSQQRQVPVVFQ